MSKSRKRYEKKPVKHEPSLAEESEIPKTTEVLEEPEVLTVTVEPEPEKTEGEISKEIEEFQEEIARPINMDDKKMFNAAIKKNVEDLSIEEKAAIIYRMSYLSDDERYKFRALLVKENLTKEEEDRFGRLFPNKLFDDYFPSEKDLDDHYKTHFTKGRNE